MLRLVLSCALLYYAIAIVNGQQSAAKIVIKEVDYLIYFPKGYEQADEKWPLLIFLHGGGETGTDVEKLKVTGLPKHIEEGHQFPMIIVSPQERRVGPGWDISTLYDFYEKIVDEYPVDRDRVYLTGLSMGGFGTWNFAMAFPELFAAIIPICGGTHMPEYIRRLKRVPVWCFHGDEDAVVPIVE